MAEELDLKSSSCGFESHPRYMGIKNHEKVVEPRQEKKKSIRKKQRQQAIHAKCKYGCKHEVVEHIPIIGGSVYCQGCKKICN